jgi:uncharacterized protein
MRCRLCRNEMVYVHGHAACVSAGCPMRGVNQAECCDGETIEQCPVPTSDVAAGSPAPTALPWTLPRIREVIATTPALAAIAREARAQLAGANAPLEGPKGGPPSPRTARTGALFGTGADLDPGHDFEHALRVALFTMRLGEGAFEARLGVAAALLHDVVNLPKDHPDRAKASERSADVAEGILARVGYTESERRLVCEAIRDHSYSRGAVPTSTLGRCLQDADRLEALGVLGVFRTISTGARLGGRYFHPEDPWAEERRLDDKAFCVDHFFVKLFKLADTMTTPAGRAVALRRTERMRAMLMDLGEELGVPYREPG